MSNLSEYWVWSGANKKAGICVFATSAQDAVQRLKDSGKAPAGELNAGPLPYPARPQLNPNDNPTGCPAFCYTPAECMGNSCCHKNYACSE